MQLQAPSPVLSPQRLRYRSRPVVPSPRWLYAMRLMLIGSCTGAAVGLSNVMGAAAVWVAHRQPAFYFTGWKDVRVLAIVMSLLGAAAGVAFALLLAGIERLSG